MKRRLMSLIMICLMLLPASALAEQTLQAEANEQGIHVSWNTDEECGSAVLTLYRNNWPILVTCVDCEAGEYMLPVWYMRGEGRYSVRLRTESFCETVQVDKGEAKPTPQPSVQPTIKPTQTPSAAPSVKPTAAPTNDPTVKPTEAPTAKPTVIPTAVPTSAPSGSDSSSLASQVVAQVNAERAAAGLGNLIVDADLTAAACVRAREIVERFSHTRPDGSSWSTVSGKANGENIAMGYRTADAVMAGWMNSEGHRENILRASFGSIGVCAYTVNGVTYWVQLFGR